MNKTVTIGESPDRSKDKVFNLTLIAVSDGETWKDDFATAQQTEAAALIYARKMFPYCAVVPSRKISTSPRGLLWYGVAIGFAAAFFLVTVVVAIYLPKLI
jgi:hypothetical protein